MSDELDFSGDADTADVADAQGDGSGAAATDPTSAGDGLPGFPVDGHPDWRAGAFGASDNLLGLARVSDLAAGSGDDAPPKLQFGAEPATTRGGDARLIEASNPALDYEQNSWRWNDPSALAYDLDRKKRQLAEAQTLSNASNAASWGQIAAEGALRLGSLPANVATTAMGQYMGDVETPMLQQEIQAIRSRLNQLQSRSRT